MSNINHVVIVGSGPVGSFMAALIAKLGIPVTVYEKRQEFTRKINLKIESGFFEKVRQIFDRLKIDNKFFQEVNESLGKSGDKIVIKDLEARLKAEALSLGTQSIYNRRSKFF